MENKYIASLLAADPQAAPRGGTDRLFAAPAGSFSYRGYLDQTVRFIEDIQLLQKPLWQKFVRVFTELPKPDTDDAGWRGEYWGKMMRGAAITYRYTQNPLLLRTMTETVRDMIAAAEQGGRISSYARERELRGWDMWARKYVMLGLQYFYEICPDEALKKEVIACIKGEADVILATVGEEEGKKPITETSSFWHGQNSSSVLEPMVRLNNLTGEQKYLDFASYIVAAGGNKMENIFKKALENKTSPHEFEVIKAYETISCFEGLMEYYRATGVEKWRTAAIHMANRIRTEEVSLIGCCGCWHELFDGKERQLDTEYAGIVQETCVTVTYMKFCLQLLCLTGESVWADEIERSAYNALLGAVNYDGNKQNGGLPFDSYSPLIMGLRNRATGGKKTLSDGSFYGCCACIGAAGTGLIPHASALLREDGVAINLYIQGNMTLGTPSGKPLEIAVTTDYPADGVVFVDVCTTDEAPFTLALRIPAWSAATTLSVNGEAVAVTPGTYAEITRAWQPGDRVTLTLDMRTRILHPEGELPNENSPHHVALCRGPLVLARDARLPGDLRVPVNFEADAEGYAIAEVSDAPDFRHFFAFRAKQKDGTWVELLDYASAGRTWDSRSLFSAWMPTKDYYNVDLQKPFALSFGVYTPKTFDAKPYNGSHTGLFVSDEGVVCLPAPAGLAVTPHPQADGSMLLEAEGGFLAVNAADELTVAAKGTPFTPEWAGLDRYFLRLADGRYLRGDNKTEPTPIRAWESFGQSYDIFRLKNI